MSITDAEALEALNTVLKPLGTNLRHYMPVHRDEAIEAMRGVLLAERKRAADVVRKQPMRFAGCTEVYVRSRLADAILSQAIPQSDAANLSPARSMPETVAPPTVSGSHSLANRSA